MASGVSEPASPSEPASFWSRARVAFYSAVVSQKHGEILHAEEPELEALPAAPAEPVPDIDDDERANGEQTPTASRRFVSEESEYSDSMRDTWLRLLQEEITLLKVERQNNFLAEVHDALRNPPPKQSPWANLPAPSPPPPATGTQKTPPPSLSRVVSRRTRRSKPQELPRGSLPKPEEQPRGTVLKPVVSRKGGPLIRSGSLSAVILPPVQKFPLETVFQKGGGGLEAELNSLPNRKGRGRRARAKSGLPGGLEKLGQDPPMKVPASAAQRRAQRAVLERNESGIGAATAAAEAAYVGGKRVRKMWSRMKTALGGRSKDGTGPRKPDMDALSSVVRSGELPSEKRGAAWLALALQDAQDIDDARRLYSSFLSHKLEQEAEIKRDINRTFPEHPLFQEEGGPGQKALLNVMRAYAAYDSEVGYCQGMAFLAAAFLMHMGEADAFAVLIHTTYRCGFRATFLPDMEQLQVRLYQLTQLVQEALPELDAHVEELGITPVMYAAPWFLTAFASTLPLPLVFRVIDVILAERSSAIVFKTALVLLQVSLRQLLQCTEAEHFVHFLRRELSVLLQTLPEADLEEIPAKALRVDLPFESMLRLEAEYELLAEEAATAANEIDAAADASRAAAEAWEKARAELETRLAFALQAQARAESQLAALLQQNRNHTADQNFANGETGGLGTHWDSTSVLDGPMGPNLLSVASQRPKGTPSVPLHSDQLDPDGDPDSEDFRHVPSVVILKRVFALRQEKQMLDGALRKAEAALQDAVRLENRRLDGGPASVNKPAHLRRASWTSTPTRFHQR